MAEEERRRCRCSNCKDTGVITVGLQQLPCPHCQPRQNLKIIINHAARAHKPKARQHARQHEEKQERKAAAL